MNKTKIIIKNMSAEQKNTLRKIIELKMKYSSDDDLACLLNNFQDRLILLADKDQKNDTDDESILLLLKT